jgi:TRAP-type C4-dicarboxylate transport system permease small subunit
MLPRSIKMVSDSIHWLARSAAVLCLFTMFITVMIQVLARYVLNSPPSWTEEIARYMMVWTGMLGATLSFKKRLDPILVEDIAPRFPAPARYLTMALRSLAVLVFLLPVLYFSLFNLKGQFGRGYLGRQALLTADTLGFPMSWIAVAVPLCSAIIIIHLIARWAEPHRRTEPDKSDG